ncbi:MAG: hypothetical protein AAGE52_35260 [Myxococcota bacterium]
MLGKAIGGVLLLLGASLSAEAQAPATEERPAPNASDPSEEGTAPSDDPSAATDEAGELEEPEHEETVHPQGPVPNPPSETGASLTGAQTTDVTTSREAAADDPSWHLYHEAALALAADDDELAIALLRQLVRAHPDHPAAVEARRLLRRMGKRVSIQSRSGEPRTGLARAEMTANQTIFGTAAGVTLCFAAECSGARIWTATLLIGGGIGLGTTLALTRRGVSPGQNQLYSTLPRWGYYNGWLLFTALGATFDEDSFDTVSATRGGTMASFLTGHALSLVAAAILDFTVSPTAGDVAIMDSFMIAASVVIAQIYAAVDAYDIDGSEGQLQGLMGGLLVANAAAATVAGFLTRSIDFTRGRAVLIDLGTFTGTGLGIGLVALIQGDDLEAGPVFGAGALGAAGGFALTYWLTRNLRMRRQPAVDVSLAPTRGGGMATIGATF